MSSEHRYEIGLEGDESARRLRALLAESALDAPDDLRTEVRGLIRASQRRRRRIGGAALALALLLAAAAVTLGLHGTKSRPDVAEAARIALVSPRGAAPPRSHTAPGALGVSSGSLAFPDWTRLGWRAIGERTEQRGGERLAVVTYEGPRARRIGYLIAAGAPLPQAGSTQAGSGGESYRIVRDGGLHAVTWREDGQTCVLASAETPVSTLMRLASSDS